MLEWVGGVDECSAGACEGDEVNRLPKSLWCHLFDTNNRKHGKDGITTNSKQHICNIKWGAGIKEHRGVDPKDNKWNILDNKKHKQTRNRIKQKIAVAVATANKIIRFIQIKWRIENRKITVAIAIAIVEDNKLWRATINWH